MLIRGSRAQTLALLRTVIIAIAAFGLLSLTLYMLSVGVLRHSSMRFSRIYAGDIHVDVLVVGNSRARDLVVGRAAGLRPTVFNLAYNGLDRDETFAWLRIFFEQGNTADTVLIESSAVYNQQLLCDGKPYWVLYPQLRAIEQSACEHDASMARYFPLTLFNSERYLRALYYLFLSSHGDQSWGDDYSIPERLCGHLELDGLFEFEAMAQRLDRVRVRSQIAELKQWLSAHGHNARLVFVLAPFLAEPRALRAIAELERIDRELFDAQENVSLATALGDDCGSFANTSHVGPIGRSRLSKPLFDALSDR